MQTAIERRVRNGGMGVRGRRDIYEVDAARFGLQHLQVIAVNSGLGEIPLCCGAPGLITVHNCDYFEVARAFASFSVDGRVALSSDETVADQGAP